MTKYKINIPKPCSENWDNMSAQDNGKYCKSCNNVVVDFTSMTVEEIHQYLIQHQEQKTCGRFKASQVANPTSFLQSKFENIYKRLKVHLK